MGFVQETRFSGAEWSDTALWRQWQPPQVMAPFIRLGTLTIKIRQRPSAPMPLFISCLGGDNLLFKVRGGARNVASATVQALIVRLLATQPPGCVRFTFIDPVDMGQSMEAFTQLSSYNPALVTSRVWTEPAYIEQQLSEISEYIAHIIHNVFRGIYATIEEYNERSGQPPLPYRVLVVLGFPFGFTLNGVHRLVNIAKNGTRCGVSTVVVFDAKQPQPQGFELTDLELVSTVISWDGMRFTWRGMDVGKSMASATVADGPEMDVFGDK